MALRLLLAVIGLARALLRFLEQRRLVAALEAEAARESLEASNAIIRRVLAARDGVEHDSDSLRRDPRNRDQRDADQGANEPDNPEHRLRKLL